MCGPLNREGTLCGKCKDGYGIALYSYTLECSKYWGHGYGWVLYYFLELFQITVMYFLVAIFSPLSALVFMSQVIVYTIRLNVPLNMYIENILTGFPYVAWHMEFRLLSFSHSTILCKQQHQDYSCTCTWVYSGILSHLSYFTDLHMHKTPWQQLQTSCLAMEAILQIFCLLKEEMGLHSINN